MTEAEEKYLLIYPNALKRYRESEPPIKLCIPTKEFKRIQEAASLLGMSVETFITAASLGRAQHILAQEVSPYAFKAPTYDHR